MVFSRDAQEAALAKMEAKACIAIKNSGNSIHNKKRNLEKFKKELIEFILAHTLEDNILMHLLGMLENIDDLLYSIEQIQQLEKLSA